MAIVESSEFHAKSTACDASKIRNCKMLDRADISVFCDRIPSLKSIGVRGQGLHQVTSSRVQQLYLNT
jgi:hypothetical protein